MNAQEAGEFVAQFIGADMGQHQERIFTTLELAANYAWDKGKWFGMTAEMFVNVHRNPRGERFIFSPKGYDTLLAVNVDGKPRLLRDSYFMFHKNGPGDIKDTHYCKWNQDVYDQGYRPIMHEITDYFPRGVMIGVRSLGVPGNAEYITIQGFDEYSDPIFSYEFKEGAKCNCFSLDEGEEAVRTVDGARIKITEDFTYLNNITWRDIRKITKTITRCPIEVTIIDGNNKGYVTSVLLPYETESKYRKYILPEMCRDYECIHGLFKISKCPTLIDGSQPIFIRSKNALLALAKGIDLKFMKEQINVGDAFLAQGVASLEEENRETQSPTAFPIQVVGIGADDFDPILTK